MIPLLPWLLGCVHAPPVASAAAPVEPASPPATPAAAPAQDATLQALLQDTRSGNAWERLSRLCDDVGNRLSGSPGYASAVVWAKTELDQAGVHAWTEPVKVPVWVRGEESLTMLTPRPRQLALLGLGGTVGTPGVEGEVAVVHDLSEIGPALKDRIALLDVPMTDGVPTVSHYGTAVVARTKGPSLAAAQGAKAVLVRSVTTRSLYTPHTGALHYEDDAPRVPAAAITGEDADQIARLVERGVPVRLRLALGAQTLPDVDSASVLAEIRGAEKPDEIVLIGAHLDSWDVGQGAHDDGAGVVEVIDAMAHLQKLGVQPRRTIRAVLYANEENGGAGGRAYAQAHAGEKHVAAMETDLGGGRPLSWGATGSPEALAWLARTIAPLGMPLDGEGGGADITPLGPSGALLIGLRPDDSHYFDIHHTNADTPDKVDPAALQEGTAAVAGLAWLLANAD